jgi:WS/DGAT/MGAT family acyltransferase
MPRYSYTRLSAQDTSFLMFESANQPMHVAAVQILEAGALKTRQGGIDIERYKRAIESVLHRIPRYRQKLGWIPIENRPIWVDDRHFNIDYHIRHSALPRPGGKEELLKLVARLLTRQLDRTRPLWEIQVIEGLDEEHFAVFSKIHHCMIDGASGADISQILMSPSADTEINAPVPFIPRPAPDRRELVRHEIGRRVAEPLRLVRGIREFTRQTENVRDEIGLRVRALREMVGWAFQPASETPMNGDLGPHRRLEWFTHPLDDVKEVRRKLNCTVNDVVLATVAGAVRDYLVRRSVDPGEIDFRVSAPVSVRRDEEKGKLGNHVSSWIVGLPIDESDPLARVKRIREVTAELKESKQALGVEMMMKAAEMAPPTLMSLGSQASSGPINMIVTNVPGPQFPLYILGAKLLETVPLVPLLANTGLGIALFSYDGKLSWGFNADYELIPDLADFQKIVVHAFDELSQAASLRVASAPVEEKAASARPRARRRTRAAAGAAKDSEETPGA